MGGVAGQGGVSWTRGGPQGVRGGSRGGPGGGPGGSGGSILAIFGDFGHFGVFGPFWAFLAIFDHFGLNLPYVRALFWPFWGIWARGGPGGAKGGALLYQCAFSTPPKTLIFQLSTYAQTVHWYPKSN